MCARILVATDAARKGAIPHGYHPPMRRSIDTTRSSAAEFPLGWRVDDRSAIFRRRVALGVFTATVLLLGALAVTWLLRDHVWSAATLGSWRIHAAVLAAGAILAFVATAAARHADPTHAGRTLADQLRASEDRLQAIIGSAMDAIITTDDAQRIVLFNAAAERLFGLPASAAVGSPLDRLIPARFRDRHGAHVRQFGATGETTRRMGGRSVLYGLRADGVEFPLDASISHATTDGERYYTVILRDVSMRVAAEAEIERSHRELADLSRVANESLEAERRRVARELHDELGQSLTAIKMDLLEMKRRLPAELDALHRQCDNVRELVDETVAATRRIASDLRPLMLDDLGLGAAIEWLAHGFESRTGIAVALTVEDAVAQVDDPLASAMFRIVQESLVNIARHARAARVTVRIDRDGDHARVTVEDDGCGLTPADTAKPGSFGLRGIRERTRLLGGSATVDSPATGGVVVTVRIPLASQSARPAHRHPSATHAGAHGPKGPA